jgi:NADH dehydrogenase
MLAAADCAMDPVRPRVVIVGGGFGGLAAAKALKRAPVDVTLIDRENYHLFQPLLYQVATAELAETDVAEPLRMVLGRQRNARVMLGEVTRVDLDRRCVTTNLGEVPYDFLILATGAEPNYFGRDAWESIAPSPKSLDAALEIRRRVLTAMDQADGITDPVEQQLLLEFVVVGGGPTGVEFAGALGEARASLAKTLRLVDPRSMRVHLVQGQPRVLPSFPEDLSRKAATQLEQLGVIIHTGKRVTALDATGVTLDDGARLEAATVIWTAGIRPTSLAAKLPGEHARGRVVVAPDLSLPGHPEVFAIGDMAHLEQDGVTLPGVSPVAIQEGRAAARSIVRSIEKRAREPFRYFDKGTMAAIGHFRAVAQVGRVHISGIAAWFMWGLVHLFYLAGVRNRFAVIFNWAWLVTTRRRATPIIVGTQFPLAPPAKEQPRLKAPGDGYQGRAHA